jgi:protein involved in ribonucleotide reduction
MFEVEPRTYQQNAKKEKNIVSLRVMDFIHYKKSLMLLRTYVAAFDYLFYKDYISNKKN